MNVGTVLSPRGSSPRAASDSGPSVEDLRGKVVGLRRDTFWKSWDWVTEEWAPRLRALGADVRIWRAPVKKGEAVLAAGAEFNEFLAAVDVAVVGLCNCGSCSMWAIHDGLAALNRGITTVAVATQQFETLVRALAANGGWPNMRTLVLPFPLEGREETDVREIAGAHFASLLEAIGVTMRAKVSA